MASKKQNSGHASYRNGRLVRKPESGSWDESAEQPYVTEMEKLLRWLKMMNVTEYVKVESGPPC